jgi:class 3 adenylate cyclase
MSAVPETKYAVSDGVHIAYQVHGSGSVDLVIASPAVSHLDLRWDHPTYSSVLNRLGSFARVISFDKRGSGLSDRVRLPTMEEQVADIAAVMDAAGSDKAYLFGGLDGGVACLIFAATYPQRAAGVITYATPPRFRQSDDFPWGLDDAGVEMFLDITERHWGDPMLLSVIAPSASEDPAFVDWFVRLQRSAVSPGAAAAWIRDLADLDLRDAIATVSTPVLVLNRKQDPVVDPGAARYLADLMPNAQFVELPGQDYLFWVGDAAAVIEQIQRFTVGTHFDPEPDRVLATLLFTDIVGSTELATSVGDRKWRDLLDQHNSVVRRQLGIFRGTEIDTAGDGFFAMFDGPARAVRCAGASTMNVRSLGMDIRAGVHTGEVERVPDGVRGLAVHVGARITGLAPAGRVWASRTVKDLVAGSGLSFADRGSHRLKGVNEEWQLFELEQPARS